ncbi:MAG: aspartate kinase [Bacteroidales bacterium]|nr:aspartate kinase [Bacteroidales bacterium]MDD4575221.1 aspartate kinase [Bacteroidales bacterium]
MRVFKFGGASISSKQSIDNVLHIIESYANDNLVVVISAMGKITNALELLMKAHHEDQIEEIKKQYTEIVKYHLNIAQELFGDSDEHKMNTGYLLKQLDNQLKKEPTENYDYDYDQIVSFGELLSTQLISDYFNYKGLQNQLFDARFLIRTEDTYREARVDWEKTKEKVQQQIGGLFKDSNSKIAVTQGFIGATAEHNTTTLGREGSDYTAAIIAYTMDAKDVTIWKDVPGLLNADPKYFPDAVLLDEIPYREAIELAFYGASVIHPKTIKPLQNKQIPLYVKSFINPSHEGSLIQGNLLQNTIPCYIFKRNQVLLSIIPKDFSFIEEENFSLIFGLFAHFGIRINLMQNSAISFTVCADYKPNRFQALVDELNTEFSVRYNLDMELITIRNYDDKTIDRILNHRKVFFEQKSRSTIQMVVGKTQ